MSNALSSFFDQLDGSRPQSPKAIVDAIEEDQAIINDLIDSLYSADPQVCISAAAVLGQLSDRRAIEPLSHIVNDETQFAVTRNVAARSLRRIAYNALFGSTMPTTSERQLTTTNAHLPKWLTEELSLLAYREESSSMLYAPSIDVYDGAAPERLPDWLRVSTDEIRSYTTVSGELPHWLGS